MLGLGHSYSRAHVKFNVNREDNMIIQAICILDQVDAWGTSDVDRQGPEHVLDACEGVVQLALPGAEGHREGQHVVRARGEADPVAQVP